MDFLKIKDLTFHKFDSDNEIEIEVDGFGRYISIQETEKLIQFLITQLQKIKINK